MEDLPYNEFMVGFPDGWEDRTEVLFVGPKTDGRSPTVTIKRLVLKFEQTLAEFEGFQLHGLGVLLGVKKPDVIEEAETTLGGLPAYARVYRLRFAGKMLTQKQIYALRGLTGYVVTMTSAVERYADDLPIFDEVVRRFQFR